MAFFWYNLEIYIYFFGMAEVKNKQQIREELKKELEKCLLIEKTERDFWLKNLPTLPFNTALNVLKSLEAKNNQFEEYVMTVLANDPDQKYLKQLKADIKKIKQNAFKLEEGEEAKVAESKLLEDLDKI